MRNSINTAGFSEIMHDAKLDPAEATFSYGAVAHASPGRGVSVSLSPALFGTVKSARRCVLEVGTGSDRSDSPSPMELALIGVVSCGLTTVLIGGTARNAVFDHSAMSIEYARNADGHDASCRLTATGDVDGVQVQALVEQMRCFSPNFATMTGAVPVSLEFDLPNRPDPDIPLTSAADGSDPTTSVNVRWVSGMQLEADIASGRMMYVDQPKQVGGADWGPNPQEYLLMALAADVAQGLLEATRERIEAGQRWEVTAVAREDMRGLLLRQYDVVTLQDVTCSVRVPDCLRADARTVDLLTEAFRNSTVRDLIASPHEATVALDPAR